MTQAKKTPPAKAAKQRSRKKAPPGVPSKPKRSRSASCARDSRQAAKQPLKPKQTKSATVLALLRRAGGATLTELMSATGWQAHSVRGFLSGTVRKRLNLTLQSKATDSVRRYWIEAPTGTGSSAVDSDLSSQRG